MGIAIKRAYEEPGRDDGRRVLIDRLWPRGLPKERARIDEWMKELAPSTELRKWFGHDPDKWAEFEQRYFDELDAKGELVKRLIEEAHGRGRVTLLYGARDTAHNNAVALRDYIAGHGRTRRRPQ